MGKLTLAVPNGSLEKQVVDLLKSAGLNIARPGRRFTVPVDHLLVGKVVFMRPQHMTREVAKGLYDLAICGRDFYEEYHYSQDCYKDECANAWCICLGSFIGENVKRKPTKIVLFTSSDDSIGSLLDIPAGESILSEYPNLTRSLLNIGLRNRRFANSHEVRIVPSWGSTEAQVSRDYRFGVCLTESGATLAANGLKVVEVLLDTYPVLLAPSWEFRGLPDWKIEAVNLFTTQLQRVGLLVANKKGGLTKQN